MKLIILVPTNNKCSLRLVFTLFKRKERNGANYTYCSATHFFTVYNLCIWQWPHLQINPILFNNYLLLARMIYWSGLLVTDNIIYYCLI